MNWCEIKIDNITSLYAGINNFCNYDKVDLYIDGKKMDLRGNLVFPEGVSSINSLFSGCSRITSVTLPSSIESIGDGAFLGVSRLQSITIPSGLKSIGVAAFSGCGQLTAIEIPSGVTSIGSYAFASCKSLKSICIPASVESYGLPDDPDIFGGCCFREITLPLGGRKLKGFGSHDHEGDIHNGNFSGILRKVTIVGDTYLADGAFDGFRGLREVVIPESVKTIGKDIFDLSVERSVLIWGYRGSAAEKYAIENDIQFAEIRDEEPGYPSVIESGGDVQNDPSSARKFFSLVDAATGIRVDAEEGTFAEGTEFAAEPVSGDDARRKTISAALEGKGTDYTAYELSASKNGESVSPKKPLKATFPVPSGYGKAGLLLIGADGRAKELPVTLNADGTLTAELSELGLCVVYQKGAAGADPAQPTDAEEPGSGFPVWIAVAIGGAVVAGGAAALVLVLKKKKAQ